MVKALYNLCANEFALQFHEILQERSAAKITIQNIVTFRGKHKFSVLKATFPFLQLTILPIGESDLENALEWDSIASVNHRRPDHEFLYDNERGEVTRPEYV